MRQLAFFVARVMMNGFVNILFAATSIALFITGFAVYGPEGNIAAQYVPQAMQGVFAYVNADWYLANMWNVFYATTALAFLGISLTVASPYLARGDKQNKLHDHLKLNSVERSLFPAMVLIMAPAALAYGVAHQGEATLAVFDGETGKMAAYAAAALVILVGGYIQVAHGIMALLFKRAWERSRALSHVEELKDNLKAAGLETKGLDKQIQSMSAGKLRKLQLKAQQAAQARKAHEEKTAELNSAMQLAGEDVANRTNELNALLSGAADDDDTPEATAASADKPVSPDTPKGPVLIEIDDTDDAPQAAPARS